MSRRVVLYGALLRARVLSAVMGCQASKQPDVLSPPKKSLAQRIVRADSALYRAHRMNGAADGRHVLGSTRHVEWAARTAQTRKNQDRFLVLAQRGSSALSCGIFDGHSLHSNQSGQAHAEAAARHLSTELFKRLKPAGLLTEAPAAPPAEPSAALVDAATGCFAEHQARCAARYKREIEGPVSEAKRKIEEELGEEVPMELPQEGGTTATVLLLHAGGLFTAWVGDSRAVIAYEDAADDAGDAGAAAERRVRAQALTVDHSTADQEEMARVLRAGGQMGRETMSGHVHVAGSEGSLKVTRSLGDSPFHSSAVGHGEVVSAAPGVRHMPLPPTARFAVVASDGVWDHLSNQQVCDIAWRAMQGWEPPNQPSVRDVESEPGAASPPVDKAKSFPAGGAAPPSLSAADKRVSGSAPSLLKPLSASSKFADSSTGSSNRSSSRFSFGGGSKVDERPGAAGAACEAVLAHIAAGQASGELDDFTDDRSICVLLLSPASAEEGGP